MAQPAPPHSIRRRCHVSGPHLIGGLNSNAELMIVFSFHFRPEPVPDRIVLIPKLKIIFNSDVCSAQLTQARAPPQSGFTARRLARYYYLGMAGDLTLSNLPFGIGRRSRKSRTYAVSGPNPVNKKGSPT